jgi:hypothetical protein
MADKAWKAFERRVAAFFHAIGRTPLSGSNSRHNTESDTLHPDLYVECKQRAKSGAVALFRETEAKARKEKKVPVVALQQTGDTLGWLIVCRPKDIHALASYAMDVESLPEIETEA